MRAKHFFYIFLFGVQISCSHSQKNSGARLKTSAYFDGNHPPSKFEPPLDFSKEKSEINPLYLRTQADYHFTLGEAFSMEGFPEKAIEEFKLTLVYDPKSPHVRMRLGTEYLKKGLISEALEELEESIVLDPKL